MQQGQGFPRPIGDLVQMASAGAGVWIDGSRYSESDLVQLASAASRGGGQVFLAGVGGWATSSLVRIGSAGQGRVVLVLG